MQAAAAARVIVRYQLAKAHVAHDQEYEAVISPLPQQTMTLEPLVVDYDDRDLLSQAPAAARYVLPAAKIANKAYWSTLSKDLTDHLANSATLEVLHNPDLKVYSRVGESVEDFSARCQQVAEDEADKKAVPLQSKYQSANSDMLNSAASVLGGLLGGRRSVSSMSTAARRASSAKSRADAAAAKVDDVQAQIQNLEADLTDELHALHAEWQGKAANIVPVEITAKRTQIRVTDLRLVWIPVA
jgi:hypothetical protein